MHGARCGAHAGQITAETESLNGWKSGICVLNDGLVPTFVKGNMELYIDLTFCSPNMLARILDWRVMEEVECGSDHQPISVRYTMKGIRFPEEAKWVRRFKEEHREPLMKRISESIHEGCSSEDFIQIMTESNQAVLGVTSGYPGRFPKYWWTKEIDELRRECIKMRTKYKVQRDTHRHTHS